MTIHKQVLRYCTCESHILINILPLLKVTDCTQNQDYTRYRNIEIYQNIEIDKRELIESTAKQMNQDLNQTFI